MKLPGICPSCKSTQTRPLPRGTETLFAYRPPTLNLRKVGASAEAHNKDAIARVNDAQAMGGTEIVICAVCGTVYARELSPKRFDVKTPPAAPAPAKPMPAAPPAEKAKTHKGGGK
jgi:hypothetical protein